MAAYLRMLREAKLIASSPNPLYVPDVTADILNEDPNSV